MFSVGYFNGMPKALVIPKSLKTFAFYGSTSRLISVKFLDPTGWYLSGTGSGESSTEIPAETLADPKSAAEFIKTNIPSGGQSLRLFKN